MAFFNFIETFFFVSLGITLVLILLLVYHFKQRLTTLEQNGETLFEIVNNLSRDVSQLKEFTVMRSIPPFIQQHQPFVEKVAETEVESDYVPVNNADVTVDHVSDNNEDDETDTDDDEDDETNTDDDEDDETDIDDDDYEEVLSNDITIQKIVVSDDEAEPDTEFHLDYEEEVELSNVEDIRVVDLDSDNVGVDPEELSEIIDITNTEEVIDLVETDMSQSVSETADIKSVQMEIYSKMSTPELKALAIQKGLSTDPSKMKRPKLLHLLESSLD